MRRSFIMLAASIISAVLLTATAAEAHKNNNGPSRSGQPSNSHNMGSVNHNSSSTSNHDCHYKINWSKRCWFSSFNCYCYYCIDDCCWYYWSDRDNCWYPNSMYPYGL
jgi:hypothetical protein